MKRIVYPSLFNYPKRNMQLVTKYIPLFFFISTFFIVSPSQAQKLKGKNIEAALHEAYNKYKDVEEGKNADYIKELANVPSDLFGIVIVTVEGKVYSIGDVTDEVSIQSVSKAFIMAKVIDEIGADSIAHAVGVEPTGEVFNSITAIERSKGKKINPLVNPGAIATTSLMAGRDSVQKWYNIRNTLNSFAGRDLDIDWNVYNSEANDNKRNQAISMLLLSYGRMYFDPLQSTDIYTKQCAVSVNAKDLAVMGSTLANGGTNPLSHEVVILPDATQHALSVMATSGLYDDAGKWLFYTGIPAKSGVGGGIVAVVPGKFGIAAIAPPLDEAGNSVKAKLAIHYIIEKLGVNPYLVEPK
ncbi:glutaminase A [Flammeovirga sp. SubArs3]|uniref:glutaminase A n=1 Tax=Flammeovirga sp. SubArs3 TaxID=2995316 RepID=UPI00248B5BAD|nr:glutaminase A [Flammeovirga sp. SubArs3]